MTTRTCVPYFLKSFSLDHLQDLFMAHRCIRVLLQNLENKNADDYILLRDYLKEKYSEIKRQSKGYFIKDITFFYTSVKLN